MDADVIVVGAGLAGLVAAHELTSRGKRVALVDQENAANLGGQAFWSFGGLFIVDSPEQRRLGIKDSFDLAWNDWQGSAKFDRVDDEDSWAVRWARAYVEFAAGEKRSWLEGHGIKFLPTVGWAERGDLTAHGHGNSVPRFHVAWGTGTGVVEPFVGYAKQAARDGLLTFHHRHQVDELVVEEGTARGVRGTVLAEDTSARGVASNRDRVGDFELTARAVVVTTGGIGANHDIVRRYWPERLGTPPAEMVTGVPAYVDGRMLDISASAGCPPGQPRPHVALHRGHPELGPDLARPRHPHPPRPLLDVVRRPGPADCPNPACPATTPSAPSSTCAPPRTSRSTTTPGSSSPRRSSRRSSRSRAPSRTPTSPPRTARASSRSGSSARARRDRSTRSCARARTSSPPPTWSSSSRR